jgi:hypothetical protein
LLFPQKQRFSNVLNSQKEMDVGKERKEGADRRVGSREMAPGE